MTTTATSKNVLIIKSSPAAKQSVSNEIADYLTAQLQAQTQDYDFTFRDLNQNPAPQYDQAILQTFYAPQDQLSDEQLRISQPSLQYIAELKAADIIVFASPMHNFSITSLLKAYIDQICRIGHTFLYTKDGQQGLIKNKQALIISSAGMDFQLPENHSIDFQTPYLQKVLNFLGIEDVQVVPVQGLGLGANDPEVIKAQAKEKIQLFIETLAPAKLRA